MLVYMLRRVLDISLLLSYIAILVYCVKLLGYCNARYYISWYTAYSATKVAAAGVLPKGYWILGAIKS